MDTTCPNCHQVVKSTDGFCESCWFKIDNIGGNSSNYPSLSPKPSKEAPLPSLSAGIVRKVCKNQRCANYNTAYDGIDDNYCGVCGLKLALEEEEEEEQEQEKPPDLQKRGFLVTPDKSQFEVTMTHRPIGRTHLSKYVSEDKMNYISKVHFTVFKEGEKYFVQDGKTAVQEKPSRNKTWLISGGQQKEEITEKGRRELKEGDQISVADVVTLSFILK
jgi:FHA domain